jgi:diguanylate cyclase (GGDEF)-like protein
LLKSIGVAVSHSIRSGTDLGARYGGDEFAVLLPETSLEGAARVADQIRAHFAALNEGKASLSVGVACLSAGAATGTAALLTAADNALYRAKAEGRDRVELAAAEFRASQDAAIPQTTTPVIELAAKSRLRRVA